MMKKFIKITMSQAYRIFFYKRYQQEQVALRRAQLRQRLFAALS